MVLPQTLHPDRVATIRRHKKDSVAYLLATEPNCLHVTTEIVRRVSGRTLVRVRPDTLPTPPLPDSWAMAVVLCPGDDTKAVAEWASPLPTADTRNRVWFYEAAGVDPNEAYRGWIDAGHDPEILRDRFDSWKDFNRLLGNDLNERIWRDFRSVRSA